MPVNMLWDIETWYQPLSYKMLHQLLFSLYVHFAGQFFIPPANKPSITHRARANFGSEEMYHPRFQLNMVKNIVIISKCINLKLKDGCFFEKINILEIPVIFIFTWKTNWKKAPHSIFPSKYIIFKQGHWTGLAVLLGQF